MAAVAAWAAVAATAGTAVSSADSQRRARNTATDAANRADPAAGMRPQFQDWLSQNWGRLMTTNPDEILKNPAYQFQKAEGERNVTNLNSSIFGSRRNGTLLEDMSKFNSGLLSNFTQQQFLNNMAMLGLAGNFSGLTTGNPGMSGNLALTGNQYADTQNNNMWNQLGAGISMARNTWGSTPAAWNPNINNYGMPPGSSGYGPGYGPEG